MLSDATPRVYIPGWERGGRGEALGTSVPPPPKQDFRLVGLMIYGMQDLYKITFIEYVTEYS